MTHNVSSAKAELQAAAKELDSDKQFSESVADYSNQVEEIITWLYAKESELQLRPHESSLQTAPFNQILDEYSQHEKFMTELCEYCHTIMKWKVEGQELRDDERLSAEDRDEVGIQMDAMIVCYEKLKILTTDRLRNLQRIIDEYQRSKIARLEEWLASMEMRISSSNEIGPDYEAIKRQIRNIDELRNELAQKQDFLNFISKVIIFDEIDSESLQIRSRSCDSLDRHLESMNQRWTNVCRFVDERAAKLKKAEAIWRLLYLEGPQLDSWLKRVELGLNEVSGAAQSINDPQSEKSFILKLVSRSEKIDTEIKSKQTFYTSLENRVRLEIETFEDPCSMFVIELEKRLEDMQDKWNNIMRHKRMLDYKLQTLTNPGSAELIRSIIPIPDPITSSSNNDLRFNETNQRHNDVMSPRSNAIMVDSEPLSDPMNNSNSSGDKDSSLKLNGSFSDSRVLDNSLSSGARSLICGSNNDQTSSKAIMFDHIFTPADTDDDTSYSCAKAALANDAKDDDLLETIPIEQFNMNQCQQDDFHNCRVEEWKHSLESFSNWLRQVEISLEMDGFEQTNEQQTRDCKNTWSQYDLAGQMALIKDLEVRIETTCQDEFDCLLLQGQQIIEDLIPEIGENEYETNLKEILADIEIRYGAVKRCLLNKKQEIADKEKWRKLSRKLRDSYELIINKMTEVIPELDIGVDLITLAQQQDQLMHLREELDDNELINSSIQEAKMFLRLCESIQQQQNVQQRLNQHDDSNKSNIWSPFEEFRETIEDQLDKLTLHYSELSQTIEDRLERLDHVHKEMHALQHKIQELATSLQVAEILKSTWVPLETLSIEQLSEQLEDLKLYRERLCEIESIHKIMRSIFDWMIQSDVPLSQSNIKRIEELDSIWDSIRSSVEERQKNIEQAFDEQSGSEQKFLAQTVADMPKWERRVATSKVPYFIDHESNKTLWDHPKFTQLLDEMVQFKHYVFSVYRTAMKIRFVQRRLGIDLLMLEQLKEVFETVETPMIADGQKQNNLVIDGQSGQITSINRVDTQLGIEQLIHLLKAIYERIQNEEDPNLDIPLAIDLTLNWLLNLFDSTRTGHVSALSLKVGLALMSCATREEKYIYMFELISNRASGTVDARKLGTLFEICMRIPTYLGEAESFGGSELIETSIRNCFSMSKFNPQHPNCIDLNDYLNWLKSEPQFLIWLPVLHRILISENTMHQMKCKLCGANPIIGLRYKCLSCFKYNICQKCFLIGRHIYEHSDPAKHPMQEYCSKTSSGERVRDFTKILRNKLNPRSHKS